ncbi:MAG: amidase [Rhodobacteraceae bacterium]|nr:amidase [Paracoccaceae bacterium]
MTETWLSMSAADLGRGIAAAKIDPVDLCEQYLTAIDTHRYSNRIYARTTKARARAEALAASRRAKNSVRRGPLDGVPISWKDLYDSAGTVTEAGSALLAGRVPGSDAQVLANATRAGLVCLGKTHMTELAFSGLGLNPVTQTPPNVYDPDLAPGGSSSGAATSVGFGLAAAGIGSDTGGSVRIPATWNNLVGLKTTSGLLSLSGVVPLCSRFDTVGPLCRSVEDASLLLAAMRGVAAPDLGHTPLQSLHFAVLETVAMEDCREEPLTDFETALEKLANAGAKITRIKIPEVAQAMPLSACLYTSEAYAQWGKEIEAEPNKMYPPVKERFEAGQQFSAVEYVRDWQKLHALRKAYKAATAAFDAVLIPSSAILPPDRERLLRDADYFISENLLALRNTRIGNLMGLCAITLPTGTNGCGIMAMGAPFGEAKLLRVAAAMERCVETTHPTINR